jgi:hypothetical protein
MGLESFAGGSDKFTRGFPEGAEGMRLETTGDVGTDGNAAGDWRCGDCAVQLPLEARRRHSESMTLLFEFSALETFEG